MRYLSHRQLLASTAAAGMFGTVPSLLISGRPALAMPTTTIRAAAHVIEKSGRPATNSSLTRKELPGEAGEPAQRRDGDPLAWAHATVAAGRYTNLSDGLRGPGAAYDFTLE